MKVKNIISIGVGTFIGFVFCCLITIKTILKDDDVRKASIQIISDKVSRFLYGEQFQKESYSSSYYQRDRCSGKVVYDYSNIIFETRKDAENVIANMKKIINRHGFVTVSDLYDLCNLSNISYGNKNRGWNDISSCKPVRVKAGYIIDLPKSIRFD